MEKPPTVTVFSPAKINLFLAVTGRRADGYHDLVSVAAPLDFGDQLTVVAKAKGRRRKSPFFLECDEAEVPDDASNLVLRAATAFAAATGWPGPAAFRLTKRIPLGAGLGGGSSNAVAALMALNQLTGTGLAPEALATLAAGIGADCPLFLAGGPVIMRGRGERVEPLPEAACGRLRGRRLLLFKPAAFGVDTAWAYARMATLAGGAAAGARPVAYLPATEAEARVAAWVAGAGGAEELLFNSFEPVVFRKFVALPMLLERLRTQFGLAPGMSGSGSACFVFLPEDAPVDAIIAYIHEAWGTAAFTQTATIA